MYCVNCGVKLADTEKKCPLCNTVVYHPDIHQEDVPPLYPRGKYPQPKIGSKVLNGMMIILFLIPLLVCQLADWQGDKTLSWSWFVTGGLMLSYVVLALPFWFEKPNPVIFVPCDFAAAALYVMGIDLALRGGWFLSFALPVIAALAVITCTVVTLMRYLKKGWLYILGGACIALGAVALLVEFLLKVTFGIAVVGWSVYPLIVLALLGGTLIYLAINRSAREMMERKLFF